MKDTAKKHVCVTCKKRKTLKEMFFHNVLKKPTTKCNACVRGKQSLTQRRLKAVVVANLTSPQNTKLAAASKSRDKLTVHLKGVMDHFAQQGGKVVGIALNGDEIKVTYQKEETILCA